MVWEHWVFSSSFSMCWAYITLKECGRGANWFIFLVNSFDNLYAEALRQFTTGRMVWSVLCIFIRPLMEGAEGFTTDPFTQHTVSQRLKF